MHPGSPLPLPDATAEVQAALDEVHRVRAWLAFALPADLRAEVEARLAAAHARVVDLLLAWVNLGGEIQLLAPPADVDGGEAAATVDPPPPEPGPAEPTTDTTAPDPEPPPLTEPAPPPAPRPPPASPEALQELVEVGIGGVRAPRARRREPSPAAPALRPAATPETALRQVEDLVKRIHGSTRPDDAEARHLRRYLEVAFQTREYAGAGLRRDDPRLVRLVADHVHLLHGDAFKKTRRAVRDAEDAEEDAGASPADRLPPGWLDRFGAVTRGRRGVMVGGDPRQPQWDRVKETFGFAELDWIGTEYKKKGLERVRERVVTGGVDVVLVLHRWTGHDADAVLQPTCKERGVTYIPVQQSYGATGIRLAIERFGRLGQGPAP